MYVAFFKRAIDFLVAGTALLILLPFLLVIALLLHFANEGAGIFFLQERPGKDGKIFKIVKFKTMNDRKGADGQLLPDVQRITKIGRFIRNSSIDELPQLYNVLTGDMSLIGPRPLLVKYLALYSPEQMRRHQVRPGITGWAQCNGRNNLSWGEKFKLDVWYVDNISFRTDLSIIMTTLRKVLLRMDINKAGKSVNESNQEVTVPEFNGQN